MRHDNGSGVYLGLTDDRRADPVIYRGDRQLLLWGPNGSGKDTAVIIPNLARIKASCLVIDPKGEAAAITARWRARFGRVFVFNPDGILVDTHPWLKSSGFNPLATLNPRDADHFSDRCVALAQGLIREMPGSDGAFFGGSGQDLVTALIMYEKLMRGDRASLGNVRRMLTEPFGRDDEGLPTGLAKTVFDMTQSSYEPLRFKAGRFRSGTRSVLDIISTACNDTKFLDSPAFRRDLENGSFDFADIKKEIITCYVILGADKLDSHSGWLRLVVASAINTMMRTPPDETMPRPLFIINEAGQLGTLEPLASAMGIARGFGMTLMTSWQDKSQMDAHYGKRASTFVAARGALASFAPKDWATAEYLSKICGHRAEYVTNYSGRVRDLHPAQSESLQGFPLLRPEDLMRSPPGVMLDFVEPVAYPFLTRAPGYWELPWCQGLDPNPYYRKAASPSVVGFERIRLLREATKAKKLGPNS